MDFNVKADLKFIGKVFLSNILEPVVKLWYSIKGDYPHLSEKATKISPAVCLQFTFLFTYFSMLCSQCIMSLIYLVYIFVGGEDKNRNQR